MKIKTLLRLKHMGILIAPLVGCADETVSSTFNTFGDPTASGSGDSGSETDGQDTTGDGDGDAGDGDGDAGDGDGDSGDGDGDPGDGDGDGDGDQTCIDGVVESCFSGLPENADVGDCKSGQHTCVDGVWGACFGEVLPQIEMCNNFDDDCDGMVDDGNPDGGQACFGGGQGLCSMGVQTCMAGGFTCVSSTVPAPEICFNGLDEDCNGLVDDQCSSCPYVYAFDGSAFQYESSVGGASLVGREEHLHGKGKRVRFAPLWIRLDSASMLENRGVQVEVLASEDEIVYLDHAQLTAIHHPIGHEVVSSSAMQWSTLRRKDPRQFWAFPSAKCRVPQRASWCGELDQTEALAQRTGIPAVYEHQRENFYELEFGDVQDSKRAWLLIDGWKFKRNRALPKHLRGHMPMLEIRQSDGSWLQAKPLATPRGDRKTIAVDLSELHWPTGSYQMRIWTGTHEGGKAMWYLDRLRLVESPPAPLSRSHVAVSRAQLEYRGAPTLLTPEHDDRPRLSRNDGRGELGDPETYGRFTRYGDVTALVKSADDRVVVMRQGDVVSLFFENVPMAPPGFETSVFLRTNLVYKPRIAAGATAPTALTENVAPMPCRQMQRYNESAVARDDAEYLEYMARWNTREYSPARLDRSAAA
jgi:hypothetical protein